MAAELVRELIDAGIHFGHRASRWNPKMRPYIFGKRSTIHIVDIRETVRGLLRAKQFLAKVAAQGDDVLFVGTKRQARQLIKQHAERVGMPYVAERWLGGTLTNFRTIRSRLSRLEELEAAEADGTAQEYSKKMISTRTRELRKIRRNLQGIRTMSRLPGGLVVIDVHREKSAIREAKKLGIPTVCLIDTDSDPEFADIPIPGNDDAIRSIDVVLTHLAEAIELGRKARSMPADDAMDTAARPAGLNAERGAAERRSPGDGRAGNSSTLAGRASGDSEADLTPAAASRPDLTG